MLTIAVVVVGMVTAATVFSPSLRHGVQDLGTDTRIMLETHKLGVLHGSTTMLPPAQPLPSVPAPNLPQLPRNTYNPSPDIMAGDIGDSFGGAQKMAEMAMMLASLMLMAMAGYEMSQAEKRWAAAATRKFRDRQDMVYKAMLAIDAAGGNAKLAWDRLHNHKTTKGVWHGNQQDFRRGLINGVYTPGASPADSLYSKKKMQSA